jgi:hypothetical protein
MRTRIAGFIPLCARDEARVFCRRKRRAVPPGPRPEGRGYHLSRLRRFSLAAERTAISSHRWLHNRWPSPQGAVPPLAQDGAQRNPGSAWQLGFKVPSATGSFAKATCSPGSYQQVPPLWLKPSVGMTKCLVCVGPQRLFHRSGGCTINGPDRKTRKQKRPALRQAGRWLRFE